MEKADEALRTIADQQGIKITKQQHKRAELVELVREKRDAVEQERGFTARPFVLCGLPVRRPPSDQLLHTRRNGKFMLEITAHPKYGLPFGQDRLIPMFLSTMAVRNNSPEIRFSSTAAILEMFGREKGGKEYKRLIDGFKRIFGATVFFGNPDTNKAGLFESHRFNFLKQAHLWTSADPDQQQLPGEMENVIVLSDEFYAEVTSHRIPMDLDVVRSLAHAPAVLDLCVWLMWRCFTARGEVRIPLFGDLGLVSQLGSEKYARGRRFREKLEQWLKTIKVVWPECPAYVADSGNELVLTQVRAITGPS